MSKDSSWKRTARNKTMLKKIIKENPENYIDLIAEKIEAVETQSRIDTWEELIVDGRRVYHRDGFFKVTRESGSPMKGKE